jgi:hypothetical protein
MNGDAKNVGGGGGIVYSSIGYYILSRLTQQFFI